MPGVFSKDGISFQYPENWNLEKEETDGGWMIHLQSPNTAFLMLTCDRTIPALDAVLQTALDTMKNEYEEIEVENALSTISGIPAVGHDCQFTSLDFTNTCWLRALSVHGATLLFLCQANDFEMDVAGQVFQAIFASTTIAEN